MEITKEQEVKVWEYINKFNEQNAPKLGTRSCVQITCWSKYLCTQPNGAMYYITFKENFHGKEKFSHLDYVSASQMLTYLEIHTR
jgi:hypothetical protein